MRLKHRKFTIPCHVIRFEHGDCTNGGITGQHLLVTLIGPDGPAEGSHPGDMGCPVMKTVERFLFGEWYYHAEPVEQPTTINKEPAVGPMAGGNKIWSLDEEWSRVGFAADHKLPAHDRFESVSQYAANLD